MKSLGLGLSVGSEARYFAYDAHKDQRYGKYPYIKHLDDVVAILDEYEFYEFPYPVVGYLHDILEDTIVGLEELKEEFGYTVAVLVDVLTDVNGPNRKARKAGTLERIARDPRAVVVKLADRIANVRSALVNKTSHFRMYKDEHEAFRAALEPVRFTNEIDLHRRNTQLTAMWRELDRLLGEEY